MPEEEVLNIDHHTKILLQKALNKTNTKEEAGLLLKVSGRTVYELKKKYKIKKQWH